MNQSELIEKVAQVSELNQAAAGRAVKAVVNAILDALVAGQEHLDGLGEHAVVVDHQDANLRAHVPPLPGSAARPTGPSHGALVLEERSSVYERVLRQALAPIAIKSCRRANVTARTT